MSVFWNVNASMQFLVAEAGDVERRFVGVPDGWLLREHDAAIIRRQSSQR